MDRSRRLYRYGIPICLSLWLLTATWGERTVDRDFDAQYAMGYPGLAGPGSPSARVPIVRVANFAHHDLGNPACREPDFPWRCRSRGIPIAPFVIVDDAAYWNGSLAGISGYRVSLWFFGFSCSIWFYAFWVS